MHIILVGTVSSSIFGFRHELLKQLQSKGHAVTFYVADWSESLAERARQELGISVRAYPVSRSGMNPLSDLKTFWFLYREFKRDRPDCVFCYFAKPVIWGGLAASFAGVPRRVGMLEGLGYVFTRRPGDIATKKQQILKAVQVFLYRLVVPRLSRIIFLNPDDPVDLLKTHGISPRSMSILGGIGVDLKALTYTKPPVAPHLNGQNHALVFIFVGRLLAEKGINEYIQAARIVRRNYPAVRFVALGGLDEANPGSLSNKTLSELIDDGILEHPGHVSNVADWLKDADVFVLPSYYREGVPASTQEAMAIGRAIITTDVPGCRETVVDGVNGFMAPPCSPELLAEKMIYLIEHPDLVVQMGVESRRMAEEKFDAVKVNQRLCEMLGA